MTKGTKKGTKVARGLPVDDSVAEWMKDPEFAAAWAERKLSHEIATAARGMRETAGLSQSQLAGLLGTTQSAIARFEHSEHRTPQWAMLARIGALLGKQLRFELGDPDEAKPLVEVTGRPPRAPDGQDVAA